MASVLAAWALLALTASGASASLTTIYDNIATPKPGNVPSQPFEAASAAEVGGQVEFAAGSWKNPKVTILMSSWACQSGTWFGENCTTTKGAKFEWPISVSIYEVGPNNAPGAKIGAASKVFKIPYRPSVTPVCNTTQNNKGGWYSKAAGRCFNGYAANIAVTLKVAKLPEKAIISVAYNTSDYGAEPQRPQSCNSTEAGCPYDSLNVGLESIKADAEYPLPNYAYINSTYAPEYCGSGTTVGTFGLSGSESNPCWQGYQPSFRVAASPA